MRKFQEKPKWRQFMESKVVLFFLGFLVIFFAGNVISLVGKMQDTAENKRIAEAKLKELEESKEKLAADISKLQTNIGIEESIRDKFGLVKEGENVIVIVDEKAVEEAEEKGKSSGIFSFFRNLFD